jgi:hypothetical protein
VRLLRVDVEGLELAALRSATATIATSRPIIYCEAVATQPARQPASFAKMARFFTGHGYPVYRNRGDGLAQHDRFDMARVPSSLDGGSFDCLAIPAEDVPRLIASGQLPASH